MLNLLTISLPLVFLFFSLSLWFSVILSDLRFLSCKWVERERERKKRMEVVMSRAFVIFLAVMGIVFAIVAPFVEAQSAAPAPSPTSDGTSIDLGIAYVLMLVALVLTYLIHPLDASSYNFF